MSLPAQARQMVALLRRVGARDVDWLEQTAQSLIGGAGPSCAGPAFVGASRRLGREPFATLGPDTVFDPIDLSAWSTDDLGRAVLLVALASGSPDHLRSCVDDLYFQGDSREKRAVIRALPLLPEPGQFVDLARDAGRSNETDLFAALATRNPYPADHYDDDDFNRLVMKAVFVGLALDDIVGLDRRGNLELGRMALDYLAEREAAHRSFPPDLWRLLGNQIPPSAVARMLGYLNHAIADYRLGAARALAACDDPRVRGFLVERAEVERDPDVARAISLALDRTGDT